MREVSNEGRLVERGHSEQIIDLEKLEERVRLLEERLGRMVDELWYLQASVYPDE